MPHRHGSDKYIYVQRKHIVKSLDSLLYKLLALSFFLSPTIWNTLARLSAQSFCTSPTEIDFRFYVSFIVVANFFSLWTHSTVGIPPGRPIILDFISLAYVPSRVQLLTLDFTILGLQVLETYIAHELSLPVPESSSPSESDDKQSQYILDIHFSAFLARLRQGTLPPRSDSSPSATDAAIPLPNITTWPTVSTNMRLLLRLGTIQPPIGNNAPPRTLPGSLDTDVP